MQNMVFICEVPWQYRKQLVSIWRLYTWKKFCNWNVFDSRVCIVVLHNSFILLWSKYLTWANCFGAQWFCLCAKHHRWTEELQASKDNFHSHGLTPKDYCKSQFQLACDINTAGMWKVNVKTGKGITVGNAAVPKWHFALWLESWHNTTGARLVCKGRSEGALASLIKQTYWHTFLVSAGVWEVLQSFDSPRPKKGKPKI